MEKGKLGGVVFPLVTPFCGNVINLRPVHLFYAKKRQNKCSW